MRCPHLPHDLQFQPWTCVWKRHLRLPTGDMHRPIHSGHPRNANTSCLYCHHCSQVFCGYTITANQASTFAHMELPDRRELRTRRRGPRERRIHHLHLTIDLAINQQSRKLRMDPIRWNGFQ